MVHIGKTLALVVALVTTVVAGGARAQDVVNSPRIALVIGNGAYRSAPVPTAANDAGLVAQTLAAAGFDVTGARDLDGATLRRTIHDFLDKASSGGPRGIAVVYLAGHAFQVDGENVFAPIDADVSRVSGMAIDTFRIADLTHALAATTLGAKVVVLDGARADARTDAPVAAGLALVDPEPGLLLAFNAAPGTLARIDPLPYGTYARILTQNMKQGGVPVDEMFDRVRVAVNTATGGTVVPWNVSKLLDGFSFFDRSPNAPALGSAQVPFTSLRGRPLRDFSPEQAYDVAIARDTVSSYQDYLTIFPDHPLARRIRAILAARREAAFWREAVKANAAAAYWTYQRRYRNGPHEGEARRRLARLSAAGAPPAGFLPLSFDVPPPPEDEIVFFDRHGFFLPADLPPPPPPPLFLLPPPTPDEVLKRPVEPPSGPRLLPVPAALAIPYVRSILPPGTITPPRGVGGQYRQPRPFAAGPADGGLVPRDAEARPGTGRAQATPPQPTPPVAPLVEPVLPHAPAPPKGPVVPRPMVAPIPEPSAPAPSVGETHALPKPNGPAVPVVPVAPPAPPPTKADPHRVSTKGVHPAAAAGGAVAPPRPEAPVTPAPARLLPPPGETKPVAGPGTQMRPTPPTHGQRAPAPVPATPPPPKAAPAPQHPVLAPPQPRRPEAAPPLPHASEGAHRPPRAECGHPGQPPCHP